MERELILFPKKWSLSKKLNAKLSFLTVSVELCFLDLPSIRACFSTVILNLCDARIEKYS